MLQLDGQSFRPFLTWFVAANVVTMVVVGLIVLFRQNPEGWDSCFKTDRSISAAARVAGCKAVIESARLKPTFSLFKRDDDGETLVNAYVALGNAHFEMQDYNQSIVDYSDAIRIQPNWRALVFRGDNYLHLKDNDRAFADYDEAIRREPKNAMAFLARGSANSSLQKFDKALVDYNESIRLDATVARTFFLRGTIHLAMKNYGRAVEDFNAAIALKADYTNAFVNRGAAYVGMKSYDRAVASYQEALRLDPTNAEAARELASVQCVAQGKCSPAP
jgi:tetratricopeptide (TPR) repeat protein